MLVAFVTDYFFIALILLGPSNKIGSVLYGLVCHMVLWSELLVRILSNAVDDTAKHDIMAFKYRKPTENYTYIGVTIAVITLVKCAVFSQHHPSKHNGFTFHRGKCSLSMLPVCVDISSSSLPIRISVTDGVYSSSRTMVNLALGELFVFQRNVSVIRAPLKFQQSQTHTNSYNYMYIHYSFISMADY